MQFANGSTLHAALPIYRGTDSPDHWYVMVKWEDQYVTARMWTLTDAAWIAGHYYWEPAPAMADLYVRANIHAIPREMLEEKAMESVVSR